MDKKKERIEFRVTENEKLLLRYLASRANMSISEYLSVMIDTALRSTKDKIRNGELNYENVKTYIDNKLQYREFFGK